MKALLLILFVAVVALPALSHPGVGLVEDSKGNIFYTDLAQVWKLTPDGKKSIVVPNVHTHELYIDEHDNLFGEHLWYNGDGSDTWGHYAWKLTHDQKFLKVVPDTEGFLSDYSFVRDHFGRMYWADRSRKCQHVVRQEGNRSETELGHSCMNDIRWMTATPDGIVYLVDKHDVKKVDAQGRVTTMATSLPDGKGSQSATGEHYLSGITVDKNNNVYVADFTGRKVKRIDSDGKITVVYESSAPWSPTAYLVTSDGRRVILETSVTNQVRVVVQAGGKS